MKKTALATGNKNKLREVKEIFGDSVDIISMSEAGCTLGDIEENGKTFSENSFIKSCAVSENLGIPAMADDSGIICDAISDIEKNIYYPGIISARFFEALKEMFVNENSDVISLHPFLYKKAMELRRDIKDVILKTDSLEISKDEKNYRILLSLLEGVEKRDCRFVCCATYADMKKGIKLSAEGACEGKLLYEPVITGKGFGYDPIFYSISEKKAVSELTDDEKNRISHRGKAMREMFEKLRVKILKE